MSSIRERTVLCIIDLPKKLTSRRNLLAHFSKFGDVKELTVNKDLASGIIRFSTHFDAQAAKTKGQLFEDKPLSIFWSEPTTILLDPRAKALPENDPVFHKVEPINLWEDDDKETFGVDAVQPKKPDKNSIESSNKVHSKSANVKKRLGPIMKHEASKLKTLVSPKSPTKHGGKLSAKTLLTLKKSLLNQGSKRKLVRKAEDIVQTSNKPKKSSSSEDQSPKIVPSNIEKADLKNKLALLDERDKLIRQKIKPDSNIKTAVSMKGTCPDMCPERERIMRQYSLSVAAYEMIPGTFEMDENKAVKEYTRSSADQEVPLPHDLRPEPILSMTMDYLITKIINKIDNPDENKAVWYSFCWNRLRSIRKDIILQQLCDMETVKIVEQCARFHICCYDHMWGAEVSGFDDKINTQNLNDCLQTLRHMYEDLAKQEVMCPNKSEFYSYLILLKMRSVDVMWEYQQYSLEIQISHEVQFAIQAYMAFKNNMYSKYFSLVKKASYLTSCLMQRHFEEVRSQALKTMMKAYSLPGRSVGLSSSFLVSSLKFDSHTDAQIFCEKEEVDFKLDCLKYEEDMYTSESSFLIREKRLPIASAVVGENNPLPEYIPHQVCSSFDEFGQLKQSVSFDSGEEDAILKGTCFSDSSRGSPQKSNLELKFSFKPSLRPIKETEHSFGNMFSNKEPMHGTQTNNQHLVNVEQSLHFNSQNNSAFFFGSENSGELTTHDEDMEEDYEHDLMEGEEYNMGQELNVTDSESFLAQSVSPLKSDEFETHLHTSQNNTVKTSPLLGNSFKSIGQEKKNSKPFFSAFAFSKTDSIFNSSPKLTNFSNVMKPTSHHDSSGFTNLSEQKYDSFDFSNKESYLLSQPIKECLKTVLQEGSEQNSMETTQRTKNNLLIEKLLKEEAEEEKRRIEEAKREEMEKQKKELEEQRTLRVLKKDVSERLKSYNARKCARKWKARVDILKQKRADLPMLFELTVSDHLKSWGTVNSLPASSIFQRAKYRRTLTAATSKLLKYGITDSCPYMGTYLAEALARSAAKTMKKGDIKPVFWKVAISVPWISSPSLELSVFNRLIKRWCKQTFYRKASSKIGSVESVFTSLKIPVSISVHFSDSVQSSHNMQAVDALVFIVLNETESEKLCLQRLRSLVTNQAKSREFSVAVMNVGGVRFRRMLKIELEELHEQNLVAHWSMKDWSNSDSIVESLMFLAEQINSIPYICVTPLQLLVRDFCDEFFDALSCGQHLSADLMEAVKNPNNVISLYNTCLTKLEDTLMSGKIEKHCNFSEEFKTVVPFCESGGPELLCGKLYDDAYKSQISKKINSLKLKEFQTWPTNSPIHLIEMLKTCCAEVHDLSVFSKIIRMIDPPDDSDLISHLQSISWLDIVEIWAQCNIKHCFQTKIKSKQLLVIFNKTDVEKLIKKPWWLKLPIVVQSNRS